MFIFIRSMLLNMKHMKHVPGTILASGDTE